MQFPNPIVNQLVIYGSVDNLPDVRIGPNPQITFYDGANAFLLLGIFAPSNFPRISFFDTVAGTNTVFEWIKNPGIDRGTISYYTNGGPGGQGTISFDLSHLQLEMIPTAPSTTDIKMILRDTLTAGRAEIFVSQPLVPELPTSPLSGTSETWHAAVLQNAWTSAGVAPFNAVEYRLMPDNTVRLRGVATGGAIGAGTIVFNLPLQYRPANRKQFPLSLNAGVALTAVCQVIEAGGAGAGNVTIYGVPAANAIVFDEISFMLPVV